MGMGLHCETVEVIASCYLIISGSEGCWKFLPSTSRPTSAEGDVESDPEVALAETMSFVEQQIVLSMKEVRRVWYLFVVILVVY